MVRDPRKLGDPSAGAGRHRVRGNSETGRRRYRGTENPGQPGELVSRHRRRMRDSRRLGPPPPVKPESRERGNPKPVQRRGKRGGETGRPVTSQPAARKHAKVGATRRSIAGTANGLKIRGNPEIRRQRGRRMRGTGQPGDALLAKPEDRGDEATLNLIWKLNGTMHDPMSYEFATENARDRKVSGVFIWCEDLWDPDLKFTRGRTLHSASARSAPHAEGAPGARMESI